MTANKKSVGFFTAVIACVLAVIGLVLYVMNARGAYYNDFNSVVVLLTVAGIAVLAGGVLLGGAKGILAKCSDILRIAVPVLIMAAAMVFLSGRVYSYAIIFASDLEAGNVAASAAATQSIIAVVFYTFAALIAAISAFFSLRKDK